MQTIPIETVEQVWTEIDNLDESGIKQLMRKMEENQPVILPYLLARGEEFLKDDEIGDLLVLGALSWRCFEEATSNMLTRVSLEDLEDVEKRTFTMMDNAESQEEDAALDLAVNSPQQPLLQTILGYLIEGGGEIHPDRQGIAFFLVKIIVDCLDRQVKPGTA